MNGIAETMQSGKYERRHLKSLVGYYTRFVEIRTLTTKINLNLVDLASLKNASPLQTECQIRRSELPSGPIRKLIK